MKPFLRAVERRLLADREALISARGVTLSTRREVEDSQTRGLAQAHVRRSERVRQRRELVASLVAKGLTTHEIARKLNVDRRTVVAARSAFEVRP